MFFAPTRRPVPAASQGRQTAALFAWHALTRGVRATERIMKGRESNYTFPEELRHTRARHIPNVSATPSLV